MMAVRKHPFRKQRQGSSIRSFFIPPLALLAVVLLGYVWFLFEISFSAVDAETHTDAIVVLTGGGGRIPAGVALLQQGLAGRLFISGVNPNVENTEIVKLHKQDEALSTCCITIGHMAVDTIGNATETAAWVKAQHITSLRLVTADYHMPRALIDFRAALPDTTILPNPIHPTTRPDKRTFLFSEYVKFLAAGMRYELIKVSHAL